MQEIKNHSDTDQSECGRILGVLSSSWAIAKDPGNMKQMDSSSQTPQNDSLYSN
jgi:hypothetical protein